MTTWLHPLICTGICRRPSNLLAAGICTDIPRTPAGSEVGLLSSVGACFCSPRSSVQAEEDGVGLCPLVYTQVLLLRSDGSFTLFVPLVFNRL